MYKFVILSLAIASIGATSWGVTDPAKMDRESANKERASDKSHEYVWCEITVKKGSNDVALDKIQKNQNELTDAKTKINAHESESVQDTTAKKSQISQPVMKIEESSASKIVSDPVDLKLDSIATESHLKSDQIEVQPVIKTEETNVLADQRIEEDEEHQDDLEKEAIKQAQLEGGEDQAKVVVKDQEAELNPVVLQNQKENEEIVATHQDERVLRNRRVLANTELHSYSVNCHVKTAETTYNYANTCSKDNIEFVYLDKTGKKYNSYGYTLSLPISKDPTLLRALWPVYDITPVGAGEFTANECVFTFKNAALFSFVATFITALLF